MDADFWLARWKECKIGFHEGVPNAYLVKHAERLAAARRVLVPLCGKTEDLAYLAARGHEVIGIELSEDAVRQFFAERAATPAVVARDGLTLYQAGAITVIAGDFFAATPALVGAIDAIYDRAALVALPPDLRPRYTEHLRTLAPAAVELLVTVEYADGSFEGPPFSVPTAEVHARFPAAAIAELDHGPDPRGRAMLERCYELRW